MPASASLFLCDREVSADVLLDAVVCQSTLHICSLKELMGRAWVRYRHFHRREGMRIKVIWFHPDSGHYRDDEPEFWREPTEIELALWSFPFASDWVVRGTPDRPSLSKRPVYYSASLGVKIPVELGYLWREAHRRITPGVVSNGLYYTRPLGCCDAPGLEHRRLYERRGFLYGRCALLLKRTACMHRRLYITVAGVAQSRSVGGAAIRVPHGLQTCWFCYFCIWDALAKFVWWACSQLCPFVAVGFQCALDGSRSDCARGGGRAGLA